MADPYEKYNGFTYSEYKAFELAEGERFELIYGEAYAMSAPSSRHQEVLTAILTQIANYLVGKPCKVYPAPYDVRLFYRRDETDDTVVQPDITVICDEKKRGPEGCRGAPDMVIEILSPSNTVIEMERKLKLYQEAGVKEYWIVNPENNVITVYQFKKKSIKFYTYKKDTENKDTPNNVTQTGDLIVPVGIFPDLSINLELVFAE